MSEIFTHQASALQEKKPIIFTALSKKYFYMRFHIVKFVLEQGGVPINPFTSYDYFLLDTVDRDVIRNANNNLVNLADELWVFGSISNGVLAETLHVKSTGRPIRYFELVNDRECKEISKEELVFEDGLEKFRNEL